MRFTGQNCTNLNFIKRLSVLVHALGHYPCRTFRSNHMVRLNNHFTVFILNRLTGKTSCNTLLKALNLFFSIRKCFYIHSRNLCPLFFRTAVCLPDNQILGHIYQTPGQITGVGRTQRRIGQTFTRTVCRHEILQYVQTLTEI